MNIIFLLLVCALVMSMADVNPDNGAEAPDSKDDDTGSIASLDEAVTDEKETPDPARSTTTETDGEGGDQKPLILGKFKTDAELATAYQELERKLTEVTTAKPPAIIEPEDEWVELSEEQVTSLEESDPEAHKWYLAERENRKIDAAIDKRIAPLKEQIKPIDDLQKQKLAEQFFSNEETTLTQSKKMFGDDFEGLDKQRQDVKFLQKLFTEIPQPLAHAILEHNKQGSPEYARQLLLGQIQIHNMRQATIKRSMSVSPDVGSSGGRSKGTDKASTLDEAGELAAQELGLK